MFRKWSRLFGWIDIVDMERVEEQQPPRWTISNYSTDDAHLLPLTGQIQVVDLLLQILLYLPKGDKATLWSVHKVCRAWCFYTRYLPHWGHAYAYGGNGPMHLEKLLHKAYNWGTKNQWHTGLFSCCLHPTSSAEICAVCPMLSCGPAFDHTIDPCHLVQIQ